ncbi:integrase [Enterococcus faecium]|nr:integrase [Enterococcus faecium]EHQ3682385.1 integrase [Enterococcus faecium]EME7113992.1 integrase [Enterococcus faecium]MDE5175535.1 integrase [Enterococcus faecium]MDQ8284446.1 integrase [Enterococcus faecium]HAQ0367914.1 integrase [Enterococcus faecium]
MVNFKKDKNGKYHLTASLGFDKRTGKRVQKNVEGLKQLKKKKSVYRTCF